MIRLSRIQIVLASLAAVLIMAAGCGDRVPTGVDLRPEGGLKVGSVAHALIAPTTFRAGAFSQTIGPNGGVLYFGVGSLTFPADALREWTRITATVDGLTIGATFSPHGLSFPSTAEPTLELRTSLSSLGLSLPQIVYVDKDYTVLQILPTSLNGSGTQATTRLGHFSPYILAQN
jgi:hypothetical protein